MRTIINGTCFLLLLCLLPFWPLLWLSCRIGAARCPDCGSKWQTELMGEWDGEDWKCHNCGLYWTRTI